MTIVTTKALLLLLALFAAVTGGSAPSSGTAADGGAGVAVLVDADDDVSHTEKNGKIDEEEEGSWKRMTTTMDVWKLRGGTRSTTAGGRSTHPNGSESPSVRTYCSTRRYVLNVQDYGAIGDGVTDDTYAITRTFDVASAVVASILRREDFRGDVVADGGGGRILEEEDEEELLERRRRKRLKRATSTSSSYSEDEECTVRISNDQPPFRMFPDDEGQEEGDEENDYDIVVVVWFPPNHTYLSDPIHLSTSHSNLILQIDGIVRGYDGNLSPVEQSHILQHWPKIRPVPSTGGRSEDLDHLEYDYQSLLLISNATNVVITGQGVLDARGPWWWDQYQAYIDRSKKDHEKKNANITFQLTGGRPNLVRLLNCTSVTIHNITMRDSPFWTVHPYYTDDLHITNIKIRAKVYAPNVDGIDPDSCTNVIIEYNDVSCGDDHIAIKAGICGRGKGNKFPNCADVPSFTSGKYQTRNVIVRHNTFRTGMGIAIGSESSGGISDVYVYNNTVGIHCNPGGDCRDDPTDVHGMSTCCGWSPGLHLKTTPNRGGIMERIVFENNTVYNTTSFILLEMGYQDERHGHGEDLPTRYHPTTVRDVKFINNIAVKHVDGRGGGGASWDCSSKDKCEGITVINNTIVLQQPPAAAAPEISVVVLRNDEEEDIAGAKKAHSSSPWSCHYVGSYQVSGNSPPGLEKCMEHSMDPSSPFAPSATTAMDEVLLVERRLR